MTDPVTTARATVAARLRADATRILAAADLIEAGGDDGAWALRHELLKMEAEGGDRRMESCWDGTAAADQGVSARGVKEVLGLEGDHDRS